MSHEDVVTFFHEFGHVLHHLLTRSELATYSGTNDGARLRRGAVADVRGVGLVARGARPLRAAPQDRREDPRRALQRRCRRARGFGRALDTQRQLVFWPRSIRSTTRARRGFDTTQVVRGGAERQTDSFAYVKGTHFQSSFGHLIGYDAGYYSYQWALSLSRDVLTRFRKEGLLNPTTAAAWRDEVLSKGGGDGRAGDR